MSYKLQLLLIISATLFLLFIFKYIKTHKISLKYALIWILPITVTILITVLYKFIYRFLNLLGVETIANFMFFLAVIFFSLICFSLTVIVSKQRERIILLTQEIGILNKNLSAIKNKIKKNI